jgi:hypothetical protein
MEWVPPRVSSKFAAAAADIVVREYEVDGVDWVLLMREDAAGAKNANA